MKTLYISRHGEAVNVGAPGVFSDFDRHLSEEGKAKIAKQALGLKQLGARWDKILSSPLVRARQTAELLNAPVGAPLEFCDALGDSPSLANVQKILANMPEKRILLVSHQPFIVHLTAYLLTGRRDVSFHYSTGTMACLQSYQLQDEPKGELAWFMSSEILQNLAEQTSERLNHAQL
ncbi:MAG: phosphohistidine phosphatase SixA [Candidatus Sericytochromatia bacterium]|nr:phosphohistidine phosphatase SixA [Candidatus Sericytochromatia bacterium]